MFCLCDEVFVDWRELDWQSCMTSSQPAKSIRVAHRLDGLGLCAASVDTREGRAYREDGTLCAVHSCCAPKALRIVNTSSAFVVHGHPPSPHSLLPIDHQSRKETGSPRWPDPIPIWLFSGSRIIGDNSNALDDLEEDYGFRTLR